MKTCKTIVGGKWICMVREQHLKLFMQLTQNRTPG